MKNIIALGDRKVKNVYHDNVIIQICDLVKY